MVFIGAVVDERVWDGEVEVRAHFVTECYDGCHVCVGWGGAFEIVSLAGAEDARDPFVVKFWGQGETCEEECVVVATGKLLAVLDVACETDDLA